MREESIEVIYKIVNRGELNLFILSFSSLESSVRTLF